MRLPGIGEIILILIVATAVIIGFRVFGTPSPKKPVKKPRYEEVEDDDDDEYDEEDEDARIAIHRRSRGQALGFVAIAIGLVVIISTLSMIKWIFWGPIGGFFVIAIGILAIYMSRRRR